MKASAAILSMLLCAGCATPPAGMLHSRVDTCSGIELCWNGYGVKFGIIRSEDLWAPTNSLFFSETLVTNTTPFTINTRRSITTGQPKGSQP